MSCERAPWKGLRGRVTARFAASGWHGAALVRVIGAGSAARWIGDIRYDESR
ncbi:hypothetical protein [Nocardia testacea]|uniref:hypothetical protein n=1 Tax=Nocardia testacea TaxID=248551 RepID=UPI003A8BB7C2